MERKVDMSIPWSIQVELSKNICTRRCHQCGIWSVPEHSEQFMSVELVYQISKELGKWIPKGRRIEFALQGEPLLNKDTPEIISLF